MDKTDAKLKALEKQIKATYTKAYQEMKKEASDILAKIEMNPDMSLAQKMALMTKYDRLNTLSTQLANTAYNANSTAQKMINNEMVNIYDINYNGDAERLGFGLVDHTAIKKILKEEENPFNMISSLRNKEGIRNQMKGELMQSLLKGESIQKMATRLKNVSEKSLKDSIRIARTETTRVQNSAKMDIGKHGQELGFEMWKRWVATTDGRVREDHLAMNGVEVPQDEPFVLPDGSKMMFPGDISLGADVSQVVNCRCTMIEFIKEIAKDDDIEEEQEVFDYTKNAELGDLRNIALGNNIVPFNDLVDMDEQGIRDAINNHFQEQEKKISVFKQNHNDISSLTNASEIKDALFGINRSEIPDYLNDTSNFQKYTLLKDDNVLPSVVDDIDKKEGISIFRGVHNSLTMTAKDINEFVKYGSQSYQGSGVFGDGLYFTTSQKGTEGYGGEMIIAKIKPDAKIITYSDLNDMMEKDNIYLGSADISIYAREKGFDVIAQEVSRAEDGEIYYNVLNRGALWIKK